MARVKMIYYMDILSSWCYFAEDAIAKVRSRFGEDLDFEWRIAQAVASVNGIPPRW